ncbi:MAG: HEAT repeat domain-containing protein, partial [Planctomycetota bacterium]
MGCVATRRLGATGAGVALFAAIFWTGCAISAGVTLIERAADPLAARVRVSFRDAKLPKVLDELSEAVGFKSAYVRGVERDVAFTFRSRSTTVRGVLDALCQGDELRHDSAEGQVLVAYARHVDDDWRRLPDGGFDTGFNVTDMPLREFVKSLRLRRAAIWLDPRAANLVPALNIFTTKLRPDWFLLDLIERATGVRYAIVDDTYVLSTPELISTAMPPKRERGSPIRAGSTPGPDAPGWGKVVELLEYAFALTEDSDRPWPVDAIRSPESYRAPFHIRPLHGPDTTYGPDPAASAGILRSAINDRGYRFQRWLTALVRRDGERLWPHGIPDEHKPLLTRILSTGENDCTEAREAFEARFGSDVLRQILYMKTDVDRVCRMKASWAIPYIHPDVALPYVPKLLEEGRLVQLGLLGYLRDRRTVALLARFLERRGLDTKLRRNALAGIALLAEPHFHRKWYEGFLPWWELDPSQRAGDAFPEAVEVLKKALADPDEKVRRAAYHALCHVGGHEEVVMPFLERELASDDYDRRHSAAESIAFLDFDRASPLLARFCDSEEATIRARIASLLAANGSDTALALLARTMRDSPYFIYHYAAHMVPETGRAASVKTHLGILAMDFLDEYRTEYCGGEGLHATLRGMVVEKDEETLTLSSLLGHKYMWKLLTFVLDPRAPDVREFLDKPLVPQEDQEPFEKVLDR